MKILKRGNRNQYNPLEVETHIHECPICGCLFEYSDNEIKLICEEWRVIDCPWCSEELMA